jgi:hypothetical protein
MARAIMIRHFRLASRSGYSSDTSHSNDMRNCLPASAASMCELTLAMDRGKQPECASGMLRIEGDVLAR